MNGRWLVLATAAAVALLAAAVDIQARSPEPARLQVTAHEFALVLSRSGVKAGPVVVELFNLGEDDHDLALRRLAPRARTHRVRTVDPGHLREIEARLVPGRYRLWCTLPGHRARGMVATLVVRKR
jgi:uncharacterized cupredoxin-like copper-binding protein